VIVARVSRQEWRERTGARVELAQRVLVEEVEKLQSGEDWRRYLEFQSRLHSYSPRNVMLLVVQHARAYADGRVSAPEVSQVAGFNTWRALGRSVDKGQKGYAVLAPVRYGQRVAVDDAGAARPLGRSEQPRAGETPARRQALRGFKVEFVFDVSQTSGVDLPTPPRPTLLAGEGPVGLGAAVLAPIEDRGYRVDTVADAAAIDGANG
jgi:N-terminal domain of anti-restriction factor ArdC